MIVGKLINPDLVDMATVKINHLFSSNIVFPLLTSLELLSKIKCAWIFKSMSGNYNKTQSQSVISGSKACS